MFLSIFITQTLNFCYLDSQNLLLGLYNQEVKKTDITDEVMPVDILGEKKSCIVEKKFITW